MGIPDHLTCLLRNPHAGQEAKVGTGHGTTDWFQIGKGVRQVCILVPCLFNLYVEYIIRNTRLDKAQVDIFLKLSCFYCDPTDVGSLVSGSSDFSKFTLTSGSSQFIYCLCLSWRILMITLLVCEMLGIVRLLEHSLALPFIGTGMKTDIFQSCGHSWVFHICWHIECSTFTASSFRIWNSSTGIPSLH